MKHWPWLTAIALFYAIGIGLMLLEPHREDPARHNVDTFGPDLAFIFSCKGKAEPPSDAVIEKFLQDSGFRVLNKVRLAKEQHVDYDWMSMDIEAIDGARRHISFDASPTDPGAYHVGLYSEPPTHHSTTLEDALLGFTEKTLGCENRQISHFDNPAEAKLFYDQTFSMVEGWYQQAAEMQKAGKD